MSRHSLGGFFVLSLVASSFIFAAACEDGEDLDTTKVSAVPDSGPPLPDSGNGNDSGNDSSKPELCPAADYLAGKPIPMGGTMHNGEPGSQVWKAADSPHIVPTTVGLGFGAGTSLTIEPCALVVMGDGTGMSFGGSPTADDTGDLIAAGDATHPIVITSSNPAKDAWSALRLDQTTAKTVLSYVTVEHARDGSDGASISVAGKSSPRIDHTTVRNGKGSGIRLSGYTSSFAAGSGSNVITGMGARPVVLHVGALTSFPEGTYTGNADDRIEVNHEGGFLTGNITWHKRSLPYYVDGAFITFHGKLTIEPGVHAFIGERPVGTNPEQATFGFINGGSLVANGQAEATRIVLEGDQGKAWAGFAFQMADPGLSLTASGSAVFNFVTIKNGSGGQTLAGDPACYDVVGPKSVVFMEQDVLDMKNTEIFDVGANNYAIARSFCGNGGDYMTETARKNVFHGTMHCPVSDQHECGNNPCDPAFGTPATCCNHAYACNGTTVP